MPPLACSGIARSAQCKGGLFVRVPLNTTQGMRSLSPCTMRAFMARMWASCSAMCSKAAANASANPTMRDIFGAPSKHSLLTAADNVPSMRGLGLAYKNPCPCPCTSRCAKKSTSTAFSSEDAPGLHSVAVQRPMLPAQGTEPGEVHHDTHFVVGVHPGDQGLFSEPAKVRQGGHVTDRHVVLNMNKLQWCRSEAVSWP